MFACSQSQQSGGWQISSRSVQRQDPAGLWVWDGWPNHQVFWGEYGMMLAQWWFYWCHLCFMSCLSYQVFYLLKSSDVSLSAILTSSAQFQREIATASCAALCPHLSVLMANGFNSLALRVSTDSDMVNYFGCWITQQCWLNNSEMSCQAKSYSFCDVM